MSHILQRHVSSFYAAYTDLRCTEHARLIARQSLSKHKHFDVLDMYRSQSPFPIYLSILNSNGPKCYRDYSESYCANSPNASSISLTKSFNYFAQLLMFMSIVSIIFVFITRYRQHDNKSKSCRHQPVVSNHVKNLPNEQITVNNELTEKVDKELRQWIERERCIGCRNMSETYRRTLNDRCLTKYDYPQVESLQFSNVTISNICQTCNSSTVVNATLTIHSSVFTLLNSIQHEQYLVEIRRLVGDLEISLINEIQLRFTAKQIGSVELIDSTNVSTTDGKQAILKLLTELIHQTTVQFAFQQDKISNQLPDTRPIATTVQPVEQRAAFPVPSIIDNHQQIVPPKAKTKKLLIRIVKAVKLHNVEQPFCVLELNHPKQIHQTSIAKNGLNPFWDESFIFDCDDKSNEIHLKIFDRQKRNKKLNTDITDKLYTDVSIPFSYVTSTVYKEDVRITPQYPESIIRIEFSTLSEEDTAREASGIEENHQETPSTDASPSDPPVANNFYNYTSSLSRTTTTDIFPTPPDENSPLPKPRKSRSFMNSLRSFASFRQKKNVDKVKPKKNGVISSPNSTTGANTLPHSFSADPYLYSHATGAESFRRHNTITRSFRNMFRSSSRKLPLQADNFILDHPDLLSTSPTSQKKPSFFQRFRSKRKTRRLNSLANSLTSYDRTRAESVHNTPVRANGTRPFYYTKKNQ
ncbi:unnamed protein product [Adineta ricciae]|uniref:C2 domain-containing protein n=1 Tax=Adineta ricciae TaxID=249248 RepID=A0A814HJ79_ADIRI|nr:unnamed protein product [Adineta ricciae]